MSIMPDTTRFVPGRVRRWVLRRTFSISPREDLVRLGSEYGGWTVPSTLIQSSSVCYCAGVGEDVTFDLELIRRFGCTVHAFDPTPEAHKHVESLGNLPDQFVLHRYGLWSSDDVLRFYEPPNMEEDISHSALNLHRTEKYFEAPVKSLGTISQELGHTSIDLLKMDIEGAEHAVLEHMQDEGIWPTILCIEFDQPCSLVRVRRKISMLENQGYKVVANELWNFTFVRDAVTGG
jgi:FkbM family methyltransferase